MAEVARERLARDLGERAGHLDAGRTAADDDERQQRGALRRIALALGALERQQHAAADLERVLERLQSRRDDPPLVVAEVGVRRAGGEDQIVVGRSRRRSRMQRRAASGSIARDLGRAALRRSSGAAGSSGSATRCPRATAPPSPPDTAAAGRRGDSGGRGASPRRRHLEARAPRTTLRIRRRRSRRARHQHTTSGYRWAPCAGDRHERTAERTLHRP